MTHQQAISTFAPERYLLDEMTELERLTFEEHYFSCIECADDVRAGAIMQEGAQRGFLVPGTADRASAAVRADVVPMRSRRVWYQSAVVPWTLAATLAIVAGYQSLVRVPELGRQTESQALSPITLRPASRGQEPIVPVNPASTSVALVVDVISAADAELIYDLRTAEGARVVSGRAASPPSGTPLLLLIPARAVNRPGHYVLTIAGTEYLFEVAAR